MYKKHLACRVVDEAQCEVGVKWYVQRQQMNVPGAYHAKGVARTSAAVGTGYARALVPVCLAYSFSRHCKNSVKSKLTLVPADLICEASIWKETV